MRRRGNGYEELVYALDDALASGGTVAICGHVYPDGDCIGSTLAMGRIALRYGCDVFPLSADTRVPQSMSFLPDYELIRCAEDYDDTPDIFIIVDAQDASRIGGTARFLDPRIRTFKIDHHPCDDYVCDYDYVDTDSPSATSIIWDIACDLGVIDANCADIATCCYTGLMTDTGGFQFTNTNDYAFKVAGEMAQCGADVSETYRLVFGQKSLATMRVEAAAVSNMREICGGRAILSFMTAEDVLNAGASDDDMYGGVDAIRKAAGYDAVCFVYESNGFVKGSLRSVPGVDISIAARALGGGGHMLASGFNCEGELTDELLVSIEEAMSMALAASE